VPAFSKSLVLVSIASMASSILLIQSLLLPAKTFLKMGADSEFLARDLRVVLRVFAWVLVWCTMSPELG